MWYTESLLILLGLISHLDLCGSGDGSVGVSGRGIIRVQLTVRRAHHLQGDTNSSEGLKHAHLSKGCKVEVASILAALYVFFFQNSAVFLRLSLCMRIVKDSAHSAFYKCASNVTREGKWCLDVCWHVNQSTNISQIYHFNSHLKERRVFLNSNVNPDAVHHLECWLNSRNVSIGSTQSRKTNNSGHGKNKSSFDIYENENSVLWQFDVNLPSQLQLPPLPAGGKFVPHFF